MQPSPLLGLLALNHQLSLRTQKRLNELPVLRGQVSLKDSELCGVTRKAEEQRAVYEREADTLKRNTAMLKTEIDNKDKDIRGLRKELDSRQSEIEALREELARSQAQTKAFHVEQDRRERAHEHDLSTLRLKHEQELFILKKMSSSSAKRPAKAKAP